MRENVFTFWEGPMPSYIQLCMMTWKFPYANLIILNYSNLKDYTNITDESLQKLNKFTLPQIADYVRVHVLRDQTGYWLDADTIMVTNELPTTNMIGDPKLRTQTIGYLHSDEPYSELFMKWAEYQDHVINNPNSSPKLWSIMGNSFTDNYVRTHGEVSICSVDNCWAETYMIPGNMPRIDKYKRLYFGETFKLGDLRPTNMLMLHNSWTPNWYKQLSVNDVIVQNCTMSNILRELTC